jgi:MFS family permease
VQEAPLTEPEPIDGSPWTRWLQEQRDGWRTLLDHPALRALARVEALQALGFSLAGTSYMVYVARDLALPTGVQGMVFALGAVGALAGASVAPRLGVRIGGGRAMALGLALAALGAACIPLAQGAGAVAIALLVAHQIVGDAGATLHGVHDRTLRQTAAGPASLARVDAGLGSIGQAATLAGAALGAGLGTWLSARAVLAASALVIGAAAWQAWRTLGQREARAFAG